MPPALLRLRGDPDMVRAELKEMKERETDIRASISIQQFFTKASYRQPIVLVLVIALGSQLSGFNAVSPPGLGLKVFFFI